MSLYEKDSIVALATPRGIGALAVIRVSGESLSSLFSKLTGIKKIKSRYAYYSPLVSMGREILDNVIITFYRGPASFTGEDVLEISCHGGEIVSKTIIHDLVERGCRYASPGEFSKRAFLNGKINLAEAESMNNIINAKSRLGAQRGLMELNGSARDFLLKTKDSLIELLTIIEHELDFVESEITELSNRVFKKKIGKSLELIQSVLEGSLIGNKLQSGFKVGLVGPPNAGKSSLFNSLLGYNHSIISPEKGTTRDALEVFVEINGFPVVLIDTAGHWSGKDELDALGIKKTEEVIQQADILLAVDEKNPEKFIKSFSVNEKPVIYILSKSDLKKPLKTSSKILKISSIKNINIDSLLTRLSTTIEASFFKEDVFLCSARQIILLKKARGALLALNKDLLDIELVERAVIVRAVVDLMREIFGDIYSEDILNNIFKGFCVGK